MKIYEDYNRRFGDNDSAERQAAGMILHLIKENFKIDFNNEKYLEAYDICLKWLNGEKKKRTSYDVS